MAQRRYPVVPVVETLKRVEGEVVVGTVDRAGLAGGSNARRAYPVGPAPGGVTPVPAPTAEIWTDEASLLEGL
jgi:hypothetical protein